MTDHYDTLGVGKDADASEIKRAFRKRASQTHPDRDGGDTEQFQAVRRAYEVLSDDERRARYDRTGEDDPYNPQDEAEAHLAKLFVMLIDQLDEPEYRDVIALMRENIDAVIAKQTIEKKQAESTARKYRKVALKAKRMSEGVNVMAEAAKAKLAGLERDIQVLDDAIALGERMRVMLEDYEYVPDVKPEAASDLADAVVQWGIGGFRGW